MKRWNHQAEEKPSRRFIAALTLAMVLILTAAGTSLAAVTVDVPPIPANVLEIDPISPRTATAAEPEILVWSGEISRDGQVDSYQVTLPNDGRLRAQISELYSKKAVRLVILDRLGQEVAWDNYCENGEGVTAKNLKAGDTYEIQVRQNTGFSSYQLTVGLPGGVTDISALTDLSDRISFTDQRNVYSFTVPRDGRYRFELYDMRKGLAPEIQVYDRLGEQIAWDNYCENREGVTLKNLKAGDTYEIQVRQGTGTGAYRMLIGHQKETVDVSALTLVTDSLEYTDQRNVYSFTVPRDGRYRFELYDMMKGLAPEIQVYDRLGEQIAWDNYCENHEGVTLKNLKAGDTYEIEVRQGTGTGAYRMLVGHQKETVRVTEETVIRDSVEYNDQRNVCQLEAWKDGDITVQAADLRSGNALAVYATNRLGEDIGYDSYFTNGESIVIRNVSRGDSILIEIFQNTGFGSYSLRIE